MAPGEAISVRCRSTHRVVGRRARRYSVAESLSAFARTLLRGVGVPEGQLGQLVPGGKVVRAAPS